MNRRKLIGSLTATSLLGPAAFAAKPLGKADVRPGRVVETTAGKIRGLTNNGVHVFKGVPYGEPTSGKNRFLPPIERRSWSGVRDAFEYGFSSPQRDPDMPPVKVDKSASLMDQMFIEMVRFPESEDCLVLNIGSRGLRDGGKRPVMVWLHGGGYEYGSGSTSEVDGIHLCLRGDVVVVTLNHRLNVFGFAHLDAIGGAEFAGSGNVGMLDIVAALRWVRDNIEQFGGDPSAVMVFGQSGGGRKVSVLQAMPTAKGLLHRAVIQSGPGLRMLDRETAVKATELLLTELEMKGANALDLQILPVDRLLRAYRKVARVQPSTFLVPTPSFGPVVDGNVLPQHPFDPTAPTVSADVPLMIGSTRTELSMWRATDKVLGLDASGLRATVEAILPGDAESVIDAYRKEYARATPGELSILIETDLIFGTPTKVLAARKAALEQAPVYVYRFDWCTPVKEGRLQSPHGLEVPFVFDNTRISGLFTGGGAQAASLAGKISEAWIAFARSGNPSTRKLPRWAAYDAVQRPTMLFNTDSSVANDPEKLIRERLQAILKLS
jgi:para-nitrobenzyl esterase